MSLFDIAHKEAELNELEGKTLEQDFWNDSKESGRILARIKSIKDIVLNYNKINSDLENLIEMNQLVMEENDDDLAKDILSGTSKLEKDIEKLELETYLSGKYDRNNAIVTIHPGAGGTESQDWAEMLYRMYSKWSAKSGYSINEVDFL